MKWTFLAVLMASMLFVFSPDHAYGQIPDRASDEKAIKDHIDKIIRAYIAKDRNTVKATHSDNWRGFLSGSRTIVRGIDGYMSTVDGQGILEKSNPWRIVDYKFVDYDVVFYGATGVVSYIAEFFFQNGEDKGSYFLRSIDIYAKESGKWNQVASNIGPLPEENQYGSDSLFRTLSNDEYRRLSRAREEVWTAFFANDVAKLRRLIPKETVAVSPGNPKFEDQATIFASAKALSEAGAKLTRLNFSNTIVQAYGQTVIMYSNYEYELELNGKKDTSSGRATEIFVIKGDIIENVGWHLDAIK